MRAAWTAELLKIRTVPGLRIGAGLAVLALPLFSLLVVSGGGLGSADTVTSGAATGTLVGLLGFGAWAASAASSEYAHQTIAVSLTTVPRRGLLYAAKVGAATAVAGVGAVLAAVVSFALVAAITPAGHDTGTPAALLSVVLAAVSVAAVGVAVGMLSRSSTGSIAIVAALVLLPKTAAGLLGGLQPWVVGASPGTVVTQVVEGAQLGSDQTYPGGTVAAALTMVLVAVLVVAAGGIAFKRRDG